MKSSMSNIVNFINSEFIQVRKHNTYLYIRIQDIVKFIPVFCDENKESNILTKIEMPTDIEEAKSKLYYYIVVDFFGNEYTTDCKAEKVQELFNLETLGSGFLTKN